MAHKLKTGIGLRSDTILLGTGTGHPEANQRQEWTIMSNISFGRKYDIILPSKEENHSSSTPTVQTPPKEQVQVS